MYVGYYSADKFPFPQGPSGGPYSRFPGSAGLGFYRPNQAIVRNRYAGTSQLLNGLSAAAGAVSLETLALVAGGGIAAWFLIKHAKRL